MERGRSRFPLQASYYISKPPQPYIEINCGLGEGPFYETNTKSLRFVDIVKEKLHVLELDKGPSSLRSYDLGTPVRSALCIRSNATSLGLTLIKYVCGYRG